MLETVPGRWWMLHQGSTFDLQYPLWIIENTSATEGPEILVPFSYCYLCSFLPILIRLQFINTLLKTGFSVWISISCMLGPYKMVMHQLTIVPILLPLIFSRSLVISCLNLSRQNEKKKFFLILLELTSIYFVSSHATEWQGLNLNSFEFSSPQSWIRILGPQFIQPRVSRF